MDVCSVDIPIDDFTYTVNEGPNSFAGIFSNLYVECDVTYDLTDNLGNPYSNAVIPAFSTVSGDFNFETTDRLLAGNTYSLELKCTSVVSGNSLVEPFVATIRNDCFDTVLGEAFFNSAAYAHDLWTEGKFFFNDATSTKSGCGDFTYRLIFQDTTTVSVYTIDTTGSPFVSGTPTAKDPWTLQTFDLYIEATLGEFGSVTTTTPITLTVNDPCVNAVVTA